MQLAELRNSSETHLGSDFPEEDTSTKMWEVICWQFVYMIIMIYICKAFREMLISWTFALGKGQQIANLRHTPNFWDLPAPKRWISLRFTSISMIPQSHFFGCCTRKCTAKPYLKALTLPRNPFADEGYFWGANGSWGSVLARPWIHSLIIDTFPGRYLSLTLHYSNPPKNRKGQKKACIIIYPFYLEWISFEYFWKFPFSREACSRQISRKLMAHGRFSSHV